MSIGGALDYRRLAELHRPEDPQAIAKEIRRLHASGLKAGDIAAALGIAVEQINRVISEPVT
jgi:hypothetical protein